MKVLCKLTLCVPILFLFLFVCVCPVCSQERINNRIPKLPVMFMPAHWQGRPITKMADALAVGRTGNGTVLFMKDSLCITTPLEQSSLKEAIPKFVHLCLTKASISTKVPSSNNKFILSLAVSFPFLCCFSILFNPPASSIFFFFSRKSSSLLKAI